MNLADALRLSCAGLLQVCLMAVVISQTSAQPMPNSRVNLIVAPTVSAVIPATDIMTFSARFEAAFFNSPRLWSSAGVYTRDVHCDDGQCDGTGQEFGLGGSHDFVGHKADTRAHPYIGAGVFLRKADRRTTVYPSVHTGVDLLFSRATAIRVEIQITGYEENSGGLRDQRPSIVGAAGMRFDL